jgi:hypothetical protein
MTARINRRTTVSGLINEYHRAACGKTLPSKSVRALRHPTGQPAPTLAQIRRQVRQPACQA